MPDSQILSPTVLLVEDNEINRYTVARMLRQAGFCVVEAASGAQARERLEEVRADAIVCDVDLPDVNGFELCRELKADPRFSSIPFLQMSASFTSAQHQVQGLEGGADGFLVQPFETPVLAATIRAHLRLRAAEERATFLSRQWKTTFASIRDAIVVSDAKGNITRCNPAFGVLFGLDPDELQGRSLSSLGEPVLEEAPDGTASEGAPRVEARIGRRWFRVQRDPVFDEGGQSELIQVLSDITSSRNAAGEREELMQKLEFERERLAVIFQNAPAFVAVLRGPQHVFELANPAYYELVGHRDIIGKPLLEAVPEIKGQGFTELLDGVMRTGIAFEGRAIPAQIQREPNGPFVGRFVDLFYQPLTEADGTVSGVFAHGVDVSDQVHALKEAEAAKSEAERANRLKDEFLATLSHELRTPLTSILGWANLLKAGDLSAEESERALSSIERNARAQSRLVEDILDVSRIMTGKLGLQMRQLDLASSIEGAVNSIRPAASAKGIRLVIDLSPDAGLITGDANRLQQIIWNLLSNAIKFTPRGGRVSVSLERAGSGVELSVSDSGQGIASEFLPHVFDRFRQADSSSTRVHAGLGLGLAIVRHLVELHGGTIQAHSEGVEQGATFGVRFPLLAVLDSAQDDALEAAFNGQTPSEAEQEASNSSHSPAARELQIGRLDGLRVVVVDDEPDTRVLIGMVLQSAGAQVSLASSVAQAWLLLVAPELDSRPEVLVSDIGMPGEDGYSLIRRLRESESRTGLPALPALALTAFAGAQNKAHAIEVGFNDYAAKPIEPLELVALVSRLALRG